LLRKNKTPLSPDKIRKALSEVHTSIFEDVESKNIGKMESRIPEDAIKIFELKNTNGAFNNDKLKM